MPVGTGDGDGVAVAAYRERERRAVDGRAGLHRSYGRAGRVVLVVGAVMVELAILGLVPLAWWSVGGAIVLAWLGALALGDLHQARRYPWPEPPSLDGIDGDEVSPTP